MSLTAHVLVDVDMRCDAMRCDAMRCDAMRCDAMLCGDGDGGEPLLLFRTYVPYVLARLRSSTLVSGVVDVVGC